MNAGDVAIQHPLRHPLRLRYGGLPQGSSFTVADCSGSRNDGIASVDAGCSVVAGGWRCKAKRAGRMKAPARCILLFIISAESINPCVFLLGWLLE
jgi:hypothetical protein